MFGWSLQDAASPRRTGLLNLRYNLDRRSSTPYSEADEDVMTKPYSNRSQASHCSGDSCFGSGFPSLTSTASSDSDVTSGHRGGGVSGQMPPNNHHSELECSSQSMDCWRGSVHHALAVVEQHEEEMTTLFDELHELEGDLSSINDRVTRSLHQCRSRSSLSSLPGDLQPGRLQRLPPPRRRCCFGSCLDIHSFTEEQMASIVHRLLTRICELSLGRQEGRQDVPLIV